MIKECELKEFDAEQVEKCKNCRSASRNVNDPVKKGFCQKYKCVIDDPVKKESKIITDPHHLPSLYQQGKNFLGAAVEQVKSGMKVRSDEDAAKMMLFCQKCEFWISDSQRCEKCGCYMGVKTRWASAHCPINKW